LSASASGPPSPPRRTVATGDRADLHARRYAIPFERVWRAAAEALKAEGGRIEVSDDTRGVVRAAGETGFPRQRWSAELRVGLDEDAQTRVDVTVHHDEGLDFGRTTRRARRLLDRVDEASGADERTRISPGTPAVLFAAAVLAASGCAEEPAPAAEVEGPAETAEVPAAVESIRTYERAFAFRAADTDSTLAVLWLFESDDLGEAGVRRRGRGLLLRGGEWDDFLEFEEDGLASESPWRIVPAGPLRIVAGSGDRVDNLVYEEGDRLLDLELRGGGAAWTGSRGGTFGVQDAAIVLGGRAVGGRALDLSRAWRPSEGPPGDWAFLASGDSLAIVLHSSRRDGGATAYQGWVLRGEREILLPRLTLEWSDTRAYDEARRDVPIAWSVSDSDGDLTGTLQVRAVRLRAGTGDGPLLSVDGVFEVAGVVRVEGDERAVEGILRHRQGEGR
jgi:hypothetical protein